MLLTHSVYTSLVEIAIIYTYDYLFCLQFDPDGDDNDGSNRKRKKVKGIDLKDMTEEQRLERRWGVNSILLYRILYCLLSCCLASSDLTSSYTVPFYCIIFYFILYYLISSCPIVPNSNLSDPISSYSILSFYHITYRPILSYFILSQRNLFHPILSHSIIFHFFLLHPTLSRPISFHHILFLLFYPTLFKCIISSFIRPYLISPYLILLCLIREGSVIENTRRRVASGKEFSSISCKINCPVSEEKTLSWEGAYVRVCMCVLFTIWLMRCLCVRLLSAVCNFDWYNRLCACEIYQFDGWSVWAYW